MGLKGKSKEIFLMLMYFPLFPLDNEAMDLTMANFTACN